MFFWKQILNFLQKWTLWIADKILVTYVPGTIMFGKYCNDWS